jgi:FkbM family methyltransferase
MSALLRARAMAARLRDGAAARGLLPPYGTPAHHPVFAAFPPLPAPGDGMDIDYLGLRTQAEMLPPYWQSPPAGAVPGLPAFDEEYFEWIDVLEAVQRARGSFTMIELGAGYARWAARGWAAARRLGLEARLGVVEADPQHMAWARSHLLFNGIPARDVDFIDAAVGAAPGETVFLVEMPPGAEGNTPREWYGQALSWFADGDATAAGRDYAGRDLVAMPGGWQGVRVEVRTLSAMLEGFDRVDLADLDVQGVEADAVQEAIGALTAKVGRLHIGTHSREIEARLASILGPAGWRCLRAWPCLRWNRTEFGWIRFNDGVQTWVNPRFAALPARRATRVEAGTGESHDAYFETLRRKWVEVPGDSDKGERAFSSSLAAWPDARLLDWWETQLAADSHIEIRGWYQALYRGMFRGLRVLEIGSGLGFDGTYFLSHGAEWTFCDIVPSNLEVVRRIVDLKVPGAKASYLLIEDMQSFDSLPGGFDVVWCNGSLINAPFGHARAESLRILRHLKPGGRWIELAYPPERWLREGAPALADWGRMTDGERTPWCEWYDLEKLRRRMYPARLLPVLNMPFSSANFIWFDLVFDAGEPFLLPGPAEEDAHETDVAPERLVALGHARVASRGFARTLETPGAIWSAAGAVDVRDEIAALRRVAPEGFGIAADLVCTVEAGAVGIAFAGEDGAHVSREAFVDAGPHPRRVTVMLAPGREGTELSVRNVSGNGPSRIALTAIVLRLAP